MQNLFSVILNEVKNLLREPGGSRIVVVFQILHSAYGCVQDDKNISFRMTGGSCPFSPSSAKIDTLSDYLCALTSGPRTIDFYNVLSFRKIRKCRVRGPLSLPFPPDSSLSLRMTRNIILHSVCGSVPLFYELQGYPLSVSIYAEYPDIDILVQFQHF